MLNCMKTTVEIADDLFEAAIGGKRQIWMLPAAPVDLARPREGKRPGSGRTGSRPRDAGDAR
jgi:hypothetical protein